MRAATLLVMSAIAPALAVPRLCVVAQQPDSSRSGVIMHYTPVDPEMRTVEIRQPTLVVVAPPGAGDTLSVWTTGSAVAREAGIALDSVVPGATILDPRHAGVTVVGRELTLGYLVAAPGMCPLLVSGAVPRAGLADSVRAFLRVYESRFRDR